VKEANCSVLEPYAGKSPYDNQGQRVVIGQRLMQSSSDIFLGWARNRHGKDFYVRQLRDMKFSVPVEGFSAVQLQRYAEYCGMTLAALTPNPAMPPPSAGTSAKGTSLTRLWARSPSTMPIRPSRTMQRWSRPASPDAFRH
jgi:hypothetical protein